MPPCVDRRGRPYVLAADMARALRITARTLRARVARGAVVPPVRHERGAGWDLRVAAGVLRRAQRTVPASWIRTLLDT